MSDEPLYSILSCPTSQGKVLSHFETKTCVLLARGICLLSPKLRYLDIPTI